MGLLLDTHIWLWSLLDPDRLSDSVHRAFPVSGLGSSDSPPSVCGKRFFLQSEAV